MNPHSIPCGSRAASLTALPLFLALAICPATAQGGTSKADPIGEAVQKVMAEREIPGAVLLVQRGDLIALRRAFGMRDLERALPMTEDTLFQVGSVTKVFTATLLAQLVADGTVTLADPIRKHLPAELQLADEVAAITLEQLATHRSRLPRNPVNRRDVKDSPSVMEPYSVAELYEGLAATTLAAPSDTAEYSNLGYALLGHLLERAAEQPFAELLEQRILRPLQMRDSTMIPDERLTARLAACYWPEAERKARAPWRFGEVAAFAGLHTTADDLARFLGAQLGAPLPGAGGEDPPPTLLASETRELLHTPRAELGGSRRIALGWFVDTLPGLGELLGHGGEVDGHSACIAFHPRAGLRVVVLANQGGDSAERLCRTVLQAGLPRLLGGG